MQNLKKRTVLLTGANRGLGQRTSELLLQNYSDQFVFIFTQRSKDHKDLENHFKQINSKAEFEIHSLDVESKQSRVDFINWYQNKYHTLDVLFNNAGVYDHQAAGARPTKKIAEHVLGVNFFSTVDFTEEIYPLITDDGKIIEVSSLLGQISFQPNSAKEILNDNTLTKERLYKLAQDYIDVSEDASKDLVFHLEAYYTSKALLNAYVRYVGTKYIKPNQSIFSLHPGWVQTDMGGPSAPLTKDDACPFMAKTVGELPFGRHALSGEMIFKNELMGY